MAAIKALLTANPQASEREKFALFNELEQDQDAQKMLANPKAAAVFFNGFLTKQINHTGWSVLNYLFI